MSKALIDLIKKNFGAAVLETHSLYGDDTVVVEAAAWREVAGSSLRDNPACQMDMLTDFTAVDFPEREPRFEIVAHFYSLTKGHRLRLKTRTGDDEGDDAEVDSLCEFWASANWMEREVFDMFGRDLQKSPGSAAHPDVPRVRGAPAAQGLPRGQDSTALGLPRRAEHRESRALQRRRGHVVRPPNSCSQWRRRLTGELMEPLDQELDEAELEMPTEPMLLNVGPAHPAMHGTVRCVMELSGEIIEHVDVQVGYLHPRLREDVRARHLDPGVPVRRIAATTSRPCSTTSASRWHCEKMLGVTVPERCQWYRMILGELARMSDHLTCDGAMAMELGAFTPFLWMIKAREMIWDLMEEETGARLTHSFGRVGGMASSAPPRT